MSSKGKWWKGVLFNFKKTNWKNLSDRVRHLELDCCEHCRLFPCFPLLCASSPKRANVCPELRWQLSHAKVLGEGSGWSVIRGICLFPTTQTLCLRLEQGHYSQPAMHECTAGSADIACPISILHIPSLNSPFHLECSDCIFFLISPAYSEKWKPLSVIWQAAKHPGMDVFVIKLKRKLTKTLRIQSESFKL